jgi:hypothetical protein
MMTTPARIQNAAITSLRLGRMGYGLPGVNVTAHSNNGKAAIERVDGSMLVSRLSIAEKERFVNINFRRTVTNMSSETFSSEGILALSDGVKHLLTLLTSALHMA